MLRRLWDIDLSQEGRVDSHAGKPVEKRKDRCCVHMDWYRRSSSALEQLISLPSKRISTYLYSTFGYPSLGHLRKLKHIGENAGVLCCPI